MNTIFKRKENENEKDYFTRTAALISALLKEGKVDEARDAFAVVYEELYPIVDKVLSCESRRYRLDEETAQDYQGRAHEVITKSFHKYNNPEFLQEEDKQYEIKTFIKNITRHCVRDALAHTLGISQDRCKKLLKIRKSKAKISRTQQMDEEKVTAKMIYEDLEGLLSEDEIADLLAIEKGHLSLELMWENGEKHDTDDGIDKSVYGDVLTEDCKQALDGAAAKLTDLDTYILMKEFGLLGESMLRQEMCDFVITPVFQELFDRDETIRARTNSVKTAYNKKAKIMRVLAELNGSINMSEVEGCLVSYFCKRWKQICKERFSDTKH